MNSQDQQRLLEAYETVTTSRSTQKIVRSFKQEFLALLAKYPEVTVAEDKNKALIAYASNDKGEATIDLRHNIQNYSY